MENGNYNAITKEMLDSAKKYLLKYMNITEEVTEDAEFEIVEPKQLPPIIDNELK